MLKILILAMVVYFVYRFVWRDNSLPGSPPRPNLKDDPYQREEVEDTEYTEKK
jgi:hypothetical protein